MKRRAFFDAMVAAGASTLLSPRFPARAAAPQSPEFKLKYAPHLGMFEHHAGSGVIEQLRFMASEGFTAFEDNELGKRDKAVQNAIGEELARLGMAMGVFVAHNIAWGSANLAGGDEDARREFLKEITASVDVARRVGARWMTVVPGGLDAKLPLDYQSANVIEALKRAAEILDPHGLVMVLEPLNPYRDHPGMFLTTTPQAFMICRAVNSPSCKILFDIYHQQITEGNLIPNIDYAWDEIAYFQVGDNPGRNEPTTGEINYRNIFRHLYEKDYDGVIGMEHGNSMPGREGERAVIDAYLKCDDFLGVTK